jgi:2-octaprenyl-6-methoxyphenol hydroxylase
MNACGFRTALIEARAAGAADDDVRMIALSHGSRLILERLGVWPALTGVTPITTIVVSRQRRFGRAELTAAQARVPALGYVASYACLQRALADALKVTDVQVFSGCSARELTGGIERARLVAECGGVEHEFWAQLVVLADGTEGMRAALVVERDYQQSALVCAVASEAPHRNHAFERFTPQGPLALLPAANGWSLVWTLSPARATELAALDAQKFCAELQSAFGNALGAFTLIGARQVFPLKLKYARRPLQTRVVLVGNAAQSLHPVAGQGFNLGLRDAWELVRTAGAASDPGAALILNSYFSERRFDRTATILFTDTLIRLFSNDIPLLDRVSGTGIAALSAIAPVKNFLVRRMMFGARG